ncbi:hypothetical protein ABC345_03775 [Shouchella sp. 1P09AA]|uniref:hypothetical protein n=1 Tax=unclassified Shouchella TaxID=2893065 RepID=UPI0039A04AB2
MKKVVFILSVSALVSGCNLLGSSPDKTVEAGNGYWVLKNDYANELQSNGLRNSQNQTYVNNNVFFVEDVSEGKKMAVIFSGDEDVAYLLADIDIQDTETIITVEESANTEDLTNPYLLVGMDELNGDLTVINTHNDKEIKQVDQNFERDSIN